jgi:hypothetical protein
MMSCVRQNVVMLGFITSKGLTERRRCGKADECDCEARACDGAARAKGGCGLGPLVLLHVAPERRHLRCSAVGGGG